MTAGSTARAYDALERLQAAGLKVVPVTGRPAGWCDLIARFWPVDAVVGENGAFYFAYDRDGAADDALLLEDAAPASRGPPASRRCSRRRSSPRCPARPSPPTRPIARRTSRSTFARTSPRLPDDAVARIVAMFEAAGAQAKVSSIHVNGWFGDYDKLAMSLRLLEEQFGIGPEAAREQVLFVGDSPNDAPMFAHFAHAVGVANVRDFAGRLAAEPAWVTEARGGAGFAELAAALLEAR